MRKTALRLQLYVCTGCLVARARATWMPVETKGVTGCDVRTMGVAGYTQKWPRATWMPVETKGGPGYAQQSARATWMPVQTMGVAGYAQKWPRATGVPVETKGVTGSALVDAATPVGIPAAQIVVSAPYRPRLHAWSSSLIVVRGNGYRV